MAGGTHQGSQRMAYRRATLSTYAKQQFRATNQADALFLIVKKAAELVQDEHSPDHAMIGDLQAVLVGDGLRSGEGRGRGHYFAGNVTGATGFRPELRDRWNQVQHAMAGVVIGYRFGAIGEWYAMRREKELQDRRLYELTLPLGRCLDEHNYKQLASKLLSAITGDMCWQN